MDQNQQQPTATSTDVCTTTTTATATVIAGGASAVVDTLTQATTINKDSSCNPSMPKKSLGLLAEVALRHYNEDMERQQTISKNNDNKNESNSEQQIQSSSSRIPKARTKTNRSGIFTLKQVAKFSEKRLLNTFSEYKKDIKTKRCSYRCQMLPLECQVKFDSLAADQESKFKILEHLRQHLCNLEQKMPNVKLTSCRKARIRKEKSSVVTISTSIPIKTEIDDDGAGQQIKQSSALFTDHAYSCPQVSSAVIEKEEKPKITQICNNEVLGGDTYVTLTTNNPTVVPILTQPITLPTVVTQPSIATPAPTHTIEEVPQTVEIISSDHLTPVLDPSIIQTTAAVTPSPQEPPSSADPATQAKLRALALDYIDDIRKKSSSAAKSIIVNGDKSVIYQCKICPDKQFTSTNGLIFHYKKHAGLKPYVCELCSSTFTRQHSLNYHMLIHYNKSRFVCSECSRHFRHPSHFKEHMRRHTGETPFQCSDCLIRFKTRNTYKRHLQTKHSKILTSKGIIELPNTVSYQNVPSKNVSSSTPSAVVATKGGSTGIIPPPGAEAMTNLSQQQSSSTTTTTVIKPRRKYGLRFLHKNIETITKYEQQFQHQQNVPVAATLITATNPALTAAHLSTTVDGATLSTSAAGHPAAAIAGATARTAPGSNITIVHIPQMPTVHILDNGASNSNTSINTAIGSAKTATVGGARHQIQPIARKTSLLNYGNDNRGCGNSSQQPQQHITWVSVPYNPHHQASYTDEETKTTVLTPIHVAATTNPPINESGATTNLTELTSAIPFTPANNLTSTTVYRLHTSLSPNQSTTTTIQPQPNNDNFMRLLEAIELTQVE